MFQAISAEKRVFRITLKDPITRCDGTIDNGEKKSPYILEHELEQRYRLGSFSSSREIPRRLDRKPRDTIIRTIENTKKKSENWSVLAVSTDNLLLIHSLHVIALAEVTLSPFF